SSQLVGADLVHLEIGALTGDKICLARAQLLHLNAAHRRILIGVEIVGAPVVGEPERTIELRRRQTAMIPDIQSRDVASAGDGDVPTIAVVDHTLRWGTGRDALEIAPHRDAPRNA